MSVRMDQNVAIAKTAKCSRKQGGGDSNCTPPPNVQATVVWWVREQEGWGGGTKTQTLATNGFHRSIIP